MYVHLQLCIFTFFFTFSVQQEFDPFGTWFTTGVLVLIAVLHLVYALWRTYMSPILDLFPPDILLWWSIFVYLIFFSGTCILNASGALDIYLPSCQSPYSASPQDMTCACQWSSCCPVAQRCHCWVQNWTTLCSSSSWRPLSPPRVCISALGTTHSTLWCEETQWWPFLWRRHAMRHPAGLIGILQGNYTAPSGYKKK